MKKIRRQKVKDVIIYVYTAMKTDEIVQHYHLLSFKKNFAKNYLYVYRVFQEESAILRLNVLTLNYIDVTKIPISEFQSLQK